MLRGIRFSVKLQYEMKSRVDVIGASLTRFSTLRVGKQLFQIWAHELKEGNQKETP